MIGLHLGLGLGMASGGGGALIDWNFTTGSLPGGMTFARASSGTYANSSGVLTTASTDAARFHYARQGGVWVPGGLLIEPAVTNRALQSNAFTTSPWTAAGTPTPTANVTGPDGISNSAWTLTDNAAGALEVLFQTINLTNNVTYTGSFFVKKTIGAQSSYPVITLESTAGNFIALCTIDTTNGTATAWTACTGWTVRTSSAAIEDWGDYWRVSLTMLATSNGYRFGLYAAATTDPVQSTGVMSTAVQGSVVVYGAQVEIGSKATSYIATTTGTVTRAADVAGYTIPSGVSTLRYTFDNNTTQDVATSPGAWTIPTNLNRPTIKSIVSI